MNRTVTTQAEFNQAIADNVKNVDIRSNVGVWIEVTAYGSSTVRAYDSSTVRACGSSTVRAYDSSTVTAYNSSTVTACGSSTVTAFGSSTVTAFGSSMVTAYDSSTVTAFGSSTVTAFDSSTVTACDSSTVTAYNSSTVTAGSHTAVHLHSEYATIEGGVLIDHTAVNEENTEQWLSYHGVTVTDGIATVYKAVDDNWTTPRGTVYAPGSTPSCDDWSDDNECGGGLHFSPTPAQALYYHTEATKFLAVGVLVDELRSIPGSTAKCKAPRVVTPCVEVDIDGNLMMS